MKDTSPILAVNNNQQNLNLLIRFLAKERYTTYSVKNIAEFDQALIEQKIFCAALIDISGFDAQIWTRCRQLQEKNVPFIIISSKQSMAIHEMSLGHGARSVLVKPLVIRELLTILRSLLGG